MFKEKLEFQDNSFDILSLFAAFHVMLAHLISWTFFHGNGGQLGILWRVLAPGPAVAAMFSISGFLCAASYERCGSSIYFYIKRVVRIYPALVCVVIIPMLTYIIIGSTNISLSDFLKYLFRAIVFGDPGRMYLPENAIGNGVLWTIFRQVQFYILTPFIMLFLKKAKSAFHILAGILLIGFSIIMPFLLDKTNGLIHSALGISCFPFLYMYYIGTCLYIHRNKLLRRLIRWCIPLCVLYVIIHYIVGLDTYKGDYYINHVSGVLASFLIIILSYRLGKHRVKIDVSYGVYLWHMAVLDMLIVIGIKNTGTLFVFSIILTFIMGFLSSRFVEVPICTLVSRRLQRSKNEIQPLSASNTR